MNVREYHAMFRVEDRHWWYVGLRHRIMQVLQGSAPSDQQGRQELRVLDAGCGTGGFLTHLSRHDFHWGAGIDLVWDGLKLSQSRGLCNLTQGSVTALPFQPGIFDAVVSIDVLCHTGVDERSALQEYARVVRPGGVVIVQVPAFEWLRSRHDIAVSTKRRYTRASVAALIGESGLAVRWIGYRNSLLFPLIAGWRLLTRAQAHAEEVESDVTPVPGLLNALLTRVLLAESWLSSSGMQFPFGVSVFCVAARPAEPVGAEA